ncbi:hypothetical protein VHAB30_02090 [Variovorax boronicumulans]|nr:hypothetical protein VHAB30_02090 [Variovorax boronicumulans]
MDDGNTRAPWSDEFAPAGADPSRRVKYPYMSRWFAATVLAFMLSCYGFAVLAHGLVGGHHVTSSSGERQTVATLAASLADGGDKDIGKTSSEDPSAMDEAGSEHAELVDARPHARNLLVLSAQPPRLGSTSVLSPLLDRPKRPPRPHALLAA